MKSIAIIGAGMSGLSAAHALQGQANVALFDKSRGVGGRLSTRYAGAYEFDHGAQYFTVKSPEFQKIVNTALSQGHVAPWTARAKYFKDGHLVDDTGGNRFVGTPRMNSWAKALAESLDVSVGLRVLKFERAKDGLWTLHFETGESRSGFDGVICTAPPQQAAALLPSDFSKRNAIERAKMDVCFAVMVGLDSDLVLEWDSLRVKGLPVGWLAVNSAKPGRDQNPTLVIHSAPEWSNAHVDHDKAWVENTLLSVASELVDQDLSKAPHKALHRWLYSSVAKDAGQDCLFDPALNIAACGDWCVGGRVEGAFLSGLAAARAFTL